jgi:REP element-mobilizing transposase RayT
MWKWNRRDPFLENNYYHIYNRWYNKSILFKDDHSFEKFFKYLVRYSNEFTEELKLISYSFLPNHFHLIIKNLDGTGTQLKLPVFEWRFKAKIIDNDEYLEHCLAYVNLNPLKHNIVDNIDNYKWTSYHQVDKDKINKYKNIVLEELEF